MAKRPRSARLAVTSNTRHLIARALTDDEVLTLCGWSGVATWKQQVGVLGALRRVFEGDPWLPAATGP
jgi:hypothetical protein